MDSLLNNLMQPSDEVFWRQVELFDNVDALKFKQNKNPPTLFKSPFPAEAPEGQLSDVQTSDRVPVAAPSFSGNPCISSHPSPQTDCSNLPPVQGLQNAPISSTQSAPFG